MLEPIPIVKIRLKSPIKAITNACTVNIMLNAMLWLLDKGVKRLLDIDERSAREHKQLAAARQGMEPHRFAACGNSLQQHNGQLHGNERALWLLHIKR